MALCYIAPDQGSLGFGLPIARHVTGCTVAVQQPATWDVIPPQVTRVAWYECVAALVCPSGNLVLGVEVLPQEFSTCPSMVCWVQGSLAQQDIRRVAKRRVHRPPGMDTKHECSCHKHCASFLVQTCTA